MRNTGKKYIANFNIIGKITNLFKLQSICFQKASLNGYKVCQTKCFVFPWLLLLKTKPLIPIFLEWLKKHSPSPRGLKAWSTRTFHFLHAAFLYIEAPYKHGSPTDFKLFPFLKTPDMHLIVVFDRIFFSIWYLIKN